MENKQIRSFFSRVGLSFFIFLAISQLLIGVINQLILNFAPQIAESSWFVWVLSYGVMYLIAFPIFLLCMRKVTDTLPLYQLPNPAPNNLGSSAGESMQAVSKGNAPFSPPVSMKAGHIFLIVIIGFGIVYPLNALTILLSELVQALRGSGLENPLANVVQNSNPWVNFVAIAIVAPIMEEFIFRGILYKKLVGFGGKVYVFFSALLFALYHVSPYQFLYAFVLGLVFAGLMYYTGKLKYSIIVHLCLNFFGGGSAGLILYYGGQEAVAIYSVIMVSLALIGLILGIIWIVKNRRRVVFAPGKISVPKKSVLFLNAGMLLLFMLIAALFAFVVLM